MYVGNAVRLHSNDTNYLAMYVGNAFRLHLNGINYLAMYVGNAVRHLMLVASYAESPLGDSKWLERKNCGGESLPLGRRYGFSCPLPKGRAFRLRHSSSSHLLSLAIANSDRWFAVPIGTAVWLATNI